MASLSVSWNFRPSILRDSVSCDANKAGGFFAVCPNCERTTRLFWLPLPDSVAHNPICPCSNSGKAIEVKQNLLHKLPSFFFD
eukprot:g56625.t1